MTKINRKDQQRFTRSEPTVTARQYVTTPWSSYLLQPFLIAINITSLFAGGLVLLELYAPGLPWLSFVFVCFIFALESIYTTVWLGRPGQRGLNRFAYRTAEIVFLILLVRLLTWIFVGNWPNVATLRSYLFNPLTFFEDPFFLVMTVFIFFVWQRATMLSDLFAELALDQAEATYYAESFGRHQLETRPLLVNRGQLVNNFLQHWIWGGVIVIVLTAASTIDFNQWQFDTPFALTRLGLPPQMLTALLFYFLSGFLLLSQGRLAMLNARWLISGVNKERGVERSWYRYSLWLLVAVGFIAAFLPLGSSIGISRILSALIYAVTAAISVIVFLFLTLLSLLIPNVGQPIDQPQPSQPFNLPPQEPPPPETGQTLQMVLSSAFWAVAIVMTILAVTFFLRERGIKINLQVFRVAWAALVTWLRKVWRGASRQARSLQRTVQSRLQITLPERDAGGEKRRWPFVRINALSPRDQLRYFYLSTVRRAGERGVAREQSETPLEYAQDLKENWPEAEGDVELLTDAFLKARYSPKQIIEEEVNPIKEHWRRLRARLRRRRSKSSDEET